MRSRFDVVNDLLSFRGQIGSIKKALSKFDWDLSEPLVTLNKEHIMSCLARVLNNEISLADLEEWANILELRDDIDFSDEILKQIVFELANPALSGDYSYAEIKEIYTKLKS